MKKTPQKYLAAMIICLVVSFLLIFITVFATGGRDTNEFTGQDTLSFIIFIALEAVSLLLAFFFAFRQGRLNNGQMPRAERATKTKSEKIAAVRGMILNITALITALAGAVVGMLLQKYDTTDGFAPFCIFIAGVVIAVAALLFGIIGKKRFVAKLNNKNIGDMQQYIVSHREEAEKASREKLARLKKLHRRTDCYAVMLFLLAFVISVSAGMFFETVNVAIIFACAFLFLASFSRIRFSVPEAVFDEDDCYVDEKDFSELYALVRKAADALGCEGKIRVALLSNCNAGIAKISDIYSVQLGVIMLNAFTKDELYSVLIHEFAHMAVEDKDSEKEGKYLNWLLTGGTPHYLSALTEKFYSRSDTEYQFEFSLYRYAVAILKETAADRYMSEYGDAQKAASSLLKLKYYEFFCWEKGTYDEKCIFEGEEPTKDVVTNEISLFSDAVRERAEEWNSMIDVEILSRSASHPTLKMRLEALGIADAGKLKICFEDFCPDAQKALDYMEELIYKSRVDSYTDERKEYYLEPKETVEQWENDGKLLIAQEYSDVVSALRQLGRVKEAYELCDRAIEQLPETAALFGYFMKGCFMLHCYDEEGIDYVYKAIENNSNYIDEGLSVIGEYCCLAGKQDRLDYYREKAVELAQKEKDIYSKVSVLEKGDNLAAEKLPEGMLVKILDYIKSIDKSSVKRVYLVRKTITEEFFTSAFVIEYDSDSDDEIQQEVMYKIFKYLDTCDDWQFSLFSYEDVRNVKVEQIEGSCVYEKGTETE